MNRPVSRYAFHPDRNITPIETQEVTLLCKHLSKLVIHMFILSVIYSAFWYHLKGFGMQGAKAAAIRKLDHELGIAKGSLVKSDFKFLTRLHYCAPDSVTYGPKAEWGEHEMDYILLAKKNVSLCPNPEEVQDVKYVTEAELKEMMSESNGLLWSPWFRIIVSKFLGRWWKDLDKTLTSDSLCDWQSIHKIMNP